MKKKIKVGLFIMTAVAISTVSFILGSSMSADEKRVYIPDDTLRTSIIEQIGWNPETGEEEIIENELPTVAQMERLEQFTIGETRSLEGLQYAKNVKNLSFFMQLSDVIDFRPLQGMTSLENFYGYASSDNGDDILDISAFSELTSLKYLSLGYYIQVFDFSSLSGLESLERVQVTGVGMVELPEVYVSRASKELVMKHPVTYSTQFDDERSVTATQINAAGETLGEVDVVIEGDRMTVRNIDDATVRIECSFRASSENWHFSAQSNGAIPIVWY